MIRVFVKQEWDEAEGDAVVRLLVLNLNEMQSLDDLKAKLSDILPNVKAIFIEEHMSLVTSPNQIRENDVLILDSLDRSIHSKTHYFKSRELYDSDINRYATIGIVTGLLFTVSMSMFDSARDLRKIGEYALDDWRNWVFCLEISAFACVLINVMGLISVTIIIADAAMLGKDDYIYLLDKFPFKGMRLMPDTFFIMSLFCLAACVAFYLLETLPLKLAAWICVGCIILLAGLSFFVQKWAILVVRKRVKVATQTVIKIRKDSRAGTELRQ